MKPTQVFPSIDIMDDHVVRLVKGEPNSKTVYSDDPVGTAIKWEREGAEGLHVVDLDGVFGSGSNSSLIQKLRQSVRIPVQVGGGLRTEREVENLLNLGVERVILGTLAFEDSQSIARILKLRGSERIVVALDYEGESVVTKGWTSRTGSTMQESLEHFTRLGVSRFLVTSKSRDGTKSGVDIELLKRICKITQAKVQASGGVGSITDIRSAKQAGASALIIGRALYDGDFTLKEAMLAAK